MQARLPACRPSLTAAQLPAALPRPAAPHEALSSPLPRPLLGSSSSLQVSTALQPAACWGPCCPGQPAASAPHPAQQQQRQPMGLLPRHAQHKNMLDQCSVYTWSTTLLLQHVSKFCARHSAHCYAPVYAAITEAAHTSAAASAATLLIVSVHGCRSPLVAAPLLSALLQLPPPPAAAALGTCTSQSRWRVTAPQPFAAPASQRAQSTAEGTNARLLFKACLANLLWCCWRC